MLAKTLFAALLAGAAFSAGAQTSINLSSYAVTGNYTLDALGEMGLEASAITYAQDRNSLFFVGDEGLGVVEISLTGETLGSMAFNWNGTDDSDDHNDAEGLTYLGNGQLVVIQERLQDAYQFTYSNGGTATLADSYVSISNTYVGNVGLEGISYDERDGSFVVVKQDNPQSLLAGSLSFASTGGVSGMTTLFSGASLFGLNSLSDVQTLASVDSFAGTAAADNLLVLSLDSKMLVEINRAGTVLSSLDLSGITSQAIEGVTVDRNGTIYLVAEDSGTGNSRLLVLTTPVPEPETWGMMLAGLSLVADAALRRKRRNT